ncbi:MAG: dienelactone hydrolase family protein [Steroidobacteraceae bacterium]
MQTKKLDYTDGKTKFVGHLAWDETRTGRRPGVVVFPEAFGLNDHARQRAERLAQLGFVALAADPHGEAALLTDMARLGPAIQALYADRAEWRSRARAALDALIAQPAVDGSRTAAIGFCFGGATCLELARSGAALAAIATFHARLVQELAEDAGRIRAKVLVCHGAEDPLMKQETVDTVMAEFRRDQVDWQFIYYGNAAHSFTDPEADLRKAPGFAYNRLAEERSWAVMRQLFDEAFK